MKVGFIGAGKMAEAIISDLVNSRIIPNRDICICDISEDRRRIMKRRHGVNIFADNALMLKAVDIIFLAVKPQNLEDAIKGIKPFVTSEHLIISIAAGKKISFIESFLKNAKVIRVMPNLPALISEGMSVFCTGKKVTVEDRKKVITLLSCFGQVLELPEKHFDSVTALSGSGPAFFAHFLDVMIQGGIKLGLSKRDASLLAEQTMLGTAMLLVKGEYSPDELITAVSSAKGTTEAAFKVLKKQPIRGRVENALKAAAKRSKELSQK